METFTQSSSKDKYSTNDPNQKQITEALISFIAGSLTPLSIVENPEFHLLIESLNPKYQLPSRKHFLHKTSARKISQDSN
jgi:hypothetical protein